MKSNYLTAVLSAAIALALSSCTVEQSPSESPTEQAQQASIAFQVGTWTRWPNTVNICFTNYVGPITVDGVTKNWNGWDATTYNNGKATLMTVINDTWHAASALNFVNQGECSSYSQSTTKDWLHINLDYNSGNCGWGVGTTCNIGLWDPNTVKVGTAHEVGHALGMEHEHQSPANSGTICAYEQNILDHCLACRADPSVCKSTDEYNYCVQAINDRKKDNDAAVFTPYDPDSIMNYCASRGAQDYLLTAYDRLGIEIIYPYSLTRTLVTQAAQFSVGGVAVQRSDDVIMTDWTSRGALSGVFCPNAKYNVPCVGIQWTVDSANSTTGATLAMSSLSAGGHTISGTFTDAFNRTQNTTQMSLSVNLNTDLHTALAMSSVVTL